METVQLPAVAAAFANYADDGPEMSPMQLQRFLHEFQGEPVSSSIVDAKRLIDEIHSRNAYARDGLTLGEFYQLLFSEELNPPIRDQVHHDMTAPISQYYIYTGHNSYLTGNQLSSHCSDVPIIKALQRGVRVIELDMWPNSAKDDINIVHGRTATPPVQLIKCLRSIKKHAFEASPYPVIITLEDHLTADLQAKATQMITATFGDMLFYPESENVEEFPSPESLKHRILISTEPQKDRGRSEEEYDLVCVRADDAWGNEVPDARSEVAVDDQINDCGSDEEDADEKGLPEPEYKSLITVALRKPAGKLEGALRIDPYGVGCLNLSEGKLLKAMNSHATNVIRFTRRNLVRVYPKGIRVGSSNYNPFHGWMHGAQMVAFNMQGHGRPLWLMQGFFRANGGCGFVKKPDFLRSVDDMDFSYKSLPVKTTLKVTVYTGEGWQLDFGQRHFDKYSHPDFYVRVGIVGVPEDCAGKDTKVINNNWTPVWNEEFAFPLTAPEMALLRIEVHESDLITKDDFGGQTCLPVSELRMGIRAVPLCDAMGEKYKSTKLLMSFEFC